MIESIIVAMSSLGSGAVFLVTQGLPNIVMLIVGGVLLYSAIKKDVEPLLLVPIGFGCLLVNIPFGELMDKGGILRFFYDFGIITELFPLLIFVGIGAMTDFGPLFENPKILLLGAAALRFNKKLD